MMSFYTGSLSVSLLGIFTAYALEKREEAILSPDGKMFGTPRRVMRSESEHHRANISSTGELGELSVQSSFVKSMSSEDLDTMHAELSELLQKRAVRSWGADEAKHVSRAQKVAKGLARMGEDPLQTAAGGHESHHPPAFNLPTRWLGMDTVQPPSSCQVAVGVDSGFSDYGEGSHSCTSCLYNVTHANAQPAISTTKKFQPLLKDCPALEVSNYAKFESISTLGCTNCAGRDIGLIYDYDYNISATSDGGQAIPPFGVKIGAFAYASYGLATVRGKLFMLVEDNIPPVNMNGCKSNPAGRRYALAGNAQSGDMFQCGRFCTKDHAKYPAGEHGCPCGFNDALGCGVHIELADHMMIEFRFQKQEDGVMANFEDTKGNVVAMMGQLWEAKAIFPTAGTAEKQELVIGRVVLSGNSADEGIIGMEETVEHWKNIECDMIYTSVATSGPNILRPHDVHNLVSADIVVPEITSESCELFRVTSIAGGQLRYEHGPGIWASTQATGVTAFTCPQTGASTNGECVASTSSNGTKR
jgi:hypothetical protein